MIMLIILKYFVCHGTPMNERAPAFINFFLLNSLTLEWKFLLNLFMTGWKFYKSEIKILFPGVNLLKNIKQHAFQKITKIKITLSKPGNSWRKLIHSYIILQQNQIRIHKIGFNGTSFLTSTSRFLKEPILPLENTILVLL